MVFLCVFQNPQCDLQAQDRCHRIGQTRPVMVYRLVTANTIDQRIVERAAAKRKLEKLVIHQGQWVTAPFTLGLQWVFWVFCFPSVFP